MLLWIKFISGFPIFNGLSWDAIISNFSLSGASFHTDLASALRCGTIALYDPVYTNWSSAYLLENLCGFSVYVYDNETCRCSYCSFFFFFFCLALLFASTNLTTDNRQTIETTSSSRFGAPRGSRSRKSSALKSRRKREI